MPLIDLYVPEGRLSPEAQQQLGAQLSRTVLGHEQVPDLPLNRSLAWVYIHAQPTGTLLIGGEAVDHTDPRYRVVVHVQNGYLDDEHKQAIARDVSRDIRTADPDLGTDVPRIFCVIDEVTDGNWGVEDRMTRAVESVDLLSVTDERIRAAAQRLAASSGVPAAP